MGSPNGGRKSPAGAAAPLSNDYFSSNTMRERIKQYAQVGGIPQEYLDRYTEENRSSSAGGDFVEQFES
jgi:hypothetical protein